MYLAEFELPGDLAEERILQEDRRLDQDCYNSIYPFQMFPKMGLDHLDFEPVTFLYGGNGSGKTTLLNVIAEKLAVARGAYFNRSIFFDDFVEHCEFYTPRYAPPIPEDSRIITSDDVFEYLLDIRSINEGAEQRRAELFKEYKEEKYAGFQMKSLQDYEKLKKHNAARSLTGNKYVRSRVMNNLPEKSNGESAFLYFTENINEKALYLLDEPENSLAVGLQLELQKFIEDSVRFFRCQFIIATHSPFLLSIEGAKIYDLDSEPAMVRKWTELENVKKYFSFFKKHEREF